MGTRGIILLKANDKTIGMYNHWDSYFEGLGDDVVNEINGIINKLDVLKYNLNNNVEILSDDIVNEPMQKELAEKYKDFLGGKESKWGWVFSNLGANVITQIANGVLTHMPNEIDFWNDALFCEYAYMIDLDDMAFRVYTSGKDHVLSFAINDIPKDWKRKCNKILGYDI